MATRPRPVSLQSATLPSCQPAATRSRCQGILAIAHCISHGHGAAFYLWTAIAKAVGVKLAS